MRWTGRRRLGCAALALALPLVASGAAGAEGVLVVRADVLQPGGGPAVPEAVVVVRDGATVFHVHVENPRGVDYTVTA